MSPLSPAHSRRLRAMWRSAGWPCRDALELDLIAGGLLLRCWDDQGRETLRVSDAGIDALHAARQQNRAAFDTHEALVRQVAQAMQGDGRLVWCGLSLRAPLPPHEGTDAGTRWVVCKPDVYSIRHTTLEDCTEPVVHEIKVTRADLMSDLRRPDKRAAYLGLASQCWYVLREGIACPDEVPAPLGVMLAGPGGLNVARPATKRPLRLPFAVWMGLARHAALPQPESHVSAALCNADGPGGERRCGDPVP